MLKVINEKKYLKMKNSVSGNFSLKVSDFYKDSSIYISGIQDGIETEDCLKIQLFACTVKNAANKFGAEIVSDLANKMENEAHSIMIGQGGDIKEIKNLFDELEMNFKDSYVKLKKIIN